jgi:thiol:disulfide interchange protein DsbD
MGIKWVGGVCLAYMALAYIRDALPKDTLHKLAQPGVAYVAVGGIVLLAGLALAGVHVAAERRKSPIAHLSRPTKLASIVPAIAGLFMVLTWYQLSSASTPSGAGAAALTWEQDEQAAVAKANAEHRPLLVDFGATWCGACKEFDEKTFPDSRVRAEGSRFVALHVDATDDDDENIAKVRKKYHATEGLPVVLLFGSDGREAVRFTEFVPPDRFAQAMATVQ